MNSSNLLEQYIFIHRKLRDVVFDKTKTKENILQILKKKKYILSIKEKDNKYLVEFKHSKSPLFANKLEITFSSKREMKIVQNTKIGKPLTCKWRKEENNLIYEII